MATVKFSRKVIEKEIKLTQEIVDKINMFGTPVENLDDESLEIEVLANRPDLIPLAGFLRAFKNFIGLSKGLKNYKIQKSDDYIIRVDSSVNEVRPFTVCAVVKNLKFNDETIKSLIDMQEKLSSTLGRQRKKFGIGVYPLNKIKFPIDYKALAPKEIVFTPLEMKSPLNGNQILAKHPTGREFAYLLEGKSKFPVFIDDNKKIMSMLPIINSQETGRVTKETKDIFIECSGMHLPTLKIALNIIASTLAEEGGEIYQTQVIYKKGEVMNLPDFTSQKIQISLENVNKILGTKIEEYELAGLLEKMGHKYVGKKVEIASWRADILHEVDIIEDIAIAYGYDNLKPIKHSAASIAQLSIKSKVEEKIAEILNGLSLQEISTLHLIKENESEFHKLKDKIEVEGSKTEFKILRPNLLIPALRTFSENRDAEYPQGYYEIGTIFTKDRNGIKEEQNLLMASSPGNFTEIKQKLDYLFKSLELNYSLQRIEKSPLIPGRTAAIIYNGKPIGYLGELHPIVLNELNIKSPISVVELNLEELKIVEY